MRSLLLVPLLVLAGCSTPALREPSLAPRAAEAIDPRIPVESGVAMAPADASLLGRIAELLATVRSSASRFDDVASLARQAAERAGASGSESWIEAQQALSAATAARSDTVRAIADLDSLAAERIRIRGGLAPADFEALSAATRQAAAIDGRQAEVIRSLSARLGS